MLSFNLNHTFVMCQFYKLLLVGTKHAIYLLHERDKNLTIRLNVFPNNKVISKYGFLYFINSYLKNEYEIVVFAL